MQSYEIESLCSYKVLMILWTCAWKGLGWIGRDKYDYICSRKLLWFPVTWSYKRLQEFSESCPGRYLLGYLLKTVKGYFGRHLVTVLVKYHLKISYNTTQDEMSPNHIREGRCQLWWKCFKTKNSDSFLWQYLTKFCIIMMGDTTGLLVLAVTISSLKNLNDKRTYCSSDDLDG